MVHISVLIARWVKKRLSLFLVVFGFFSFFTSPVLAYDIPASFTLPHALPYNDGTTTWEHFLAYRQNSGSWLLWYINEPNLYVQNFKITSYTEIGSNNKCFYSSYNGASWAGATCQWSPGGMFWDTVIASGTSNSVDCHDRLFASYTIFAADSHTGLSYCMDGQASANYTQGDVIFHRVNFNGTVLIGVSESAPTEYLTENLADTQYVPVPNPLDNPFGFVSALLTNMAIWLQALVIPPAGFFAEAYTQVKTEFDAKFAFYEQIKSAFTIPVGAAMTPISIGSLTLGNTTTSPIAFISSFDAATFAPFRNFLSMVMYVSLGFWLIRKMSNIFSS